MKVIAVMGSPRKKDSYQICQEIEDELKKCHKGIEIEYIFLSSMNILDCKGCGLCFQKSERLCPCNTDDLSSIKNKLLKADGIILASPVYAYQVTGPMKRFIDRMSYLFHRQELCGKPAIIVVTTDGGGSKPVYQYLKMTLSGWAVNVVGNLQITAPIYFDNRQLKGAFAYDEHVHQEAQKKIKAVSQNLYKTMSSNEIKKATFYEVFMFNCLRSKTYTSSADRAYWLEKGWLDADYFYDVKMGILKRVFGNLMKGIIHHIGKRYVKCSANRQ